MVLLCNGVFRVLAPGSATKCTAIPADYEAKAPVGMLRDAATGLPPAELTAHQRLGPDHLYVQSADRLVTTSGSGGVDLLTIQLAKLATINVTITARKRGEVLITQADADA